MTLRHAGVQSRAGPHSRGDCATVRARAGSRRSCRRTSSRPGPSRTRGYDRASRPPAHSRGHRRHRRRQAGVSSLRLATTTTFSGRAANAGRRRGWRRTRSRRPCAGRPRCARDFLPRFRDRFVRDAARADDGDVGAAVQPACPSASSRSRTSRARRRARPSSPGKRTEKLAIGRMLSAFEQVCSPTVTPARGGR